MPVMCVKKTFSQKRDIKKDQFIQWLVSVCLWCV